MIPMKEMPSVNFVQRTASTYDDRHHVPTEFDVPFVVRFLIRQSCRYGLRRDYSTSLVGIVSVDLSCQELMLLLLVYGWIVGGFMGGFRFKMKRVFLQSLFHSFFLVALVCCFYCRCSLFTSIYMLHDPIFSFAEWLIALCRLHKNCWCYCGARIHKNEVPLFKTASSRHTSHVTRHTSPNKST